MIAEELKVVASPQAPSAPIEEVAHSLRERLDRQHAWLSPGTLAVSTSLPVERVLAGLAHLETAGYARLRRDRRTGMVTQAHSRLHDPIETFWHVRRPAQ